MRAPGDQTDADGASHRSSRLSSKVPAIMNAVEARESEAMKRLRAAVEGGTDHDLEAWATTGTAGLQLLRDVVVGAINPGWDAFHARDAVDNMTAAVAMIAARHPDRFLEVFGDSTIDRHSYVLTGLGQIDDERATKRLAAAARSEDQWLRMHAANGLAHRSSPVAVQALVELIADPEYLVRYHALRGLAAIGDDTALRALRSFTAPTAFERQLADEAISAIANRQAADGP